MGGRDSGASRRAGRAASGANPLPVKASGASSWMGGRDSGASRRAGRAASGANPLPVKASGASSWMGGRASGASRRESPPSRTSHSLALRVSSNTVAFSASTLYACPQSGGCGGVDVPDSSGSAGWSAAVGLSEHRGARAGVPDRFGTRGVGLVRSAEPSAARPAGRGDGVLRRRTRAVPVGVSAGGAALFAGRSALGVAGCGFARVGEVVDLARADALGTGAVRGATGGAGEAGSGSGDTGGVVSRSAPGRVRRVDAERAGRDGEPGEVRGAGGVAWPGCLPPGARDGVGGTGDAGGIRLAGGRVCRIRGGTGRNVAAVVVAGDAGAGGPGLLRLPALAAGVRHRRRPVVACEGEAAFAGAGALRRRLLPERSAGQRPGPSAQSG